MNRGTFNKDEKSITDDRSGASYEINGLVVEKKQPDRDAFYGMETSLCKAVIFKGIKSDFKVLQDGRVNIY